MIKPILNRQNSPSLQPLKSRQWPHSFFCDLRDMHSDLMDDKQTDNLGVTKHYFQMV